MTLVQNKQDIVKVKKDYNLFVLDLASSNKVMQIIISKYRITT